MSVLLDFLFRPLILSGDLTVIDWRGRAHHYGDGTGPKQSFKIHSRMTALRIAFNPQLAAGEAYMDGTLTIEDGTLEGLIALVFRNIGARVMRYPLSGLTETFFNLKRRLDQFNPAKRSQKNVAHHYDLSDTLYDLFLDDDRQYSCAYVMSADDTLEEAQAQKKRHLAAKLLLGPDQKILDIGSGWGGLGLYLAKLSGSDVTGLTLSREQHRVSNLRAAEAGMAVRVRFKFSDYRNETGHYDRIVSVGMFEHVGINHFNEYFERIAELLKEDGIALVHAIGRADGPGATNPWIAKYIFPGGYCPALSEVFPAIERAGLHVLDVEILRLHYAETLRMWRERFMHHRDRVRALYDERFCRMWEFYLVTSEMAFRHQGQMVFQIQLGKRVDVAPITRDYITAFEATHPPAEIVAPVKKQI